METYGEINFVGKCRYNCFYCLSNQMDQLRKDTVSGPDHMSTHFSEWKGFGEYTNKLKERGLKKIFLSSTNTDPLDYKYFGDLVSYLQDDLGFSIGIRTSGYLLGNNIDPVSRMKNEISFSINSFDRNTFKKITGSDQFVDTDAIFNFIEKYGEERNIRVSIVITKYNVEDANKLIDEIRDRKLKVRYVQLRKVYRRVPIDGDENQMIFDRIKKDFSSKYRKVGGYFESDMFDVNGVTVSFWEDVFCIKNVKSVNYWINGVETENSLLVDGYVEGRKILYEGN